MKNVVLVAFAAVLFAFPSGIAAQGLGFGPRVGYQRVDDADSGEFLFGAALRVKFLSVLAAEGSIDYRQDEYGDNALTVQSWPVMVTGLVYPFPLLYGAVGAGWHNVTLDYRDPSFEDTSQQEFGWHVGGGVELPLGDAGALAADIRYVFLGLEPGELPEVVGGDSDFYMVTVALLFGSL